MSFIIWMRHEIVMQQVLTVQSPEHYELDSVALMRWSSDSTSKMPDVRAWRLSVGVGRRHPVTKRRASLMGHSIRPVWAFRHQTDGHFAQYSTAEWIRAMVAVWSVVAPAPQLEPDLLSANRLMRPTRFESSLPVTPNCDGTRVTYPVLCQISFCRKRNEIFNSNLHVAQQ